MLRARPESKWWLSHNNTIRHEILKPGPESGREGCWPWSSLNRKALVTRTQQTSSSPPPITCFNVWFERFTILEILLLYFSSFQDVSPQGHFLDKFPGCSKLATYVVDFPPLKTTSWHLASGKKKGWNKKIYITGALPWYLLNKLFLVSIGN